MARLLVVSRSMALALRLADAHDVVELGIDEVDGLLPGPGVDAVVLDVGEPARAVQTLDRLRAAGCATPLLVVSGYQPAWAGLAAVDVPGVVVVPSPITRAALLDGIAALLADRAPADGEAPGPASPATPPAGLPPRTPAPGPGWSGSAFDWWHDSSRGRRPAAGHRPARPLRRGWQPDTLAGAAARRAVEAAAQSAAAQSVPAQGGPVPGTPGAPGPAADGRAGGLAAPVGDLVEELIDRAGELRSVPDTARRVAELLLEPSEATAAAVLVPDGGQWRVEGGVGLRPAERTLALDRGHRLVGDVATGGRVLVVSDGDELREHLDGAPLAAWRHLLAVPVPRVESAVVLARGGEGQGFTGDDVTALAEPLRTAATLVENALRARHLARLLAPLGGTPEPPPSTAPGPWPGTPPASPPGTPPAWPWPRGRS